MVLTGGPRVIQVLSSQIRMPEYLTVARIILVEILPQHASTLVRVCVAPFFLFCCLFVLCPTVNREEACVLGWSV